MLSEWEKEKEKKRLVEIQLWSACWGRCGMAIVEHEMRLTAELLRLLLLLNGREHGLHSVEHCRVDEGGGRAWFRVHRDGMARGSSADVVNGRRLFIVHLSITGVHLVGRGEGWIAPGARNQTGVDVWIDVLVLMDLLLLLLLLGAFNNWERNFNEKIIWKIKVQKITFNFSNIQLTGSHEKLNLLAIWRQRKF